MNKIKKKTKKIVIIGSGFVGSTIAFSLTATVRPDSIILVDCDKKKAEAEALDIAKGLDTSHDSNITSGDYSDIAYANLIIVTAGRNRKPGEDRNDLLKDNLAISKKIVIEIKKYHTGCPILIVSNPVDTLVYAYSKWLGLNNGKVFGTGCALDSLRLSVVLSERFKIPTNKIEPCLIGEHGNDFEIIWRHTKIKGIPVNDYCKQNNIVWSHKIENEIQEAIKKTGMNVILGKGRTQFGISTVVCSLTKSVLEGQNQVFNVSSVLDSFHHRAINDVAISFPSIVGTSGIEEKTNIFLNKKEELRFLEIAGKLRKIKEGYEIKTL